MSDRVRVTRIEDLERIPSDDAMIWRPIRRPLGVTAFGINAFTAANAGDRVVESHTEDAGGARGHEEIYLVLTGHATFEAGDEEIDAPAGTVVFLPDPSMRRGAIAVEPDTTVLAIGGEPGTGVPGPVWEYWFLAEPHFKRGDHERAIEIASQGLEEYPDHPSLHYELARYHAQAGHTDQALAHLATAAAGSPRALVWAADESDFDPIRDNPAFPRP